MYKIFFATKTKSWRIISEENGTLYLGYCQDYHLQSTGGLMYPYKFCKLRLKKVKLL